MTKISEEKKTIALFRNFMKQNHLFKTKCAKIEADFIRGLMSCLVCR